MSKCERLGRLLLMRGREGKWQNVVMWLSLPEVYAEPEFWRLMQLPAPSAMLCLPVAAESNNSNNSDDSNRVLPLAQPPVIKETAAQTWTDGDALALRAVLVASVLFSMNDGAYRVDPAGTQPPTQHQQPTQQGNSQAAAALSSQLALNGPNEDDVDPAYSASQRKPKKPQQQQQQQQAAVQQQQKDVLNTDQFVFAMVHAIAHGYAVPTRPGGGGGPFNGSGSGSDDDDDDEPPCFTRLELFALLQPLAEAQGFRPEHQQEALRLMEAMLTKREESCELLRLARLFMPDETVANRFESKFAPGSALPLKQPRAAQPPQGGAEQPDELPMFVGDEQQASEQQQQQGGDRRRQRQEGDEDGGSGDGGFSAETIEMMNRAVEFAEQLDAAVDAAKGSKKNGKSGAAAVPVLLATTPSKNKNTEQTTTTAAAAAATSSSSSSPSKKAPAQHATAANPHAISVDDEEDDEDDPFAGAAPARQQQAKKTTAANAISGATNMTLNMAVLAGGQHRGVFESFDDFDRAFDNGALVAGGAANNVGGGGGAVAALGGGDNSGDGNKANAQKEKKTRHAFTKAEDDAILAGIAKYGASTVNVFHLIFREHARVWQPHRTAAMVSEHYRKTLKQREFGARAAK